MSQNKFHHKRLKTQSCGTLAQRVVAVLNITHPQAGFLKKLDFSYYRRRRILRTVRTNMKVVFALWTKVKG
jgi:hypothetical protein